MRERGMIKWAPFNSVINGEQVKKELKEKQDSIIKPTLSDEQLLELENIIKECLENGDEVIIEYYKNHHLEVIEGKITKIIPASKKIIINNQTSLYFYNIMHILEKNT